MFRNRAFLVIGLLWAESRIQMSTAFVMTPTWRTCLATSVLAATKKKKPKKNAPARSSAGFGKASTPAKSEKDQDYAVFPALEAQVAATLVPSVDDNATANLPGEIYGRLDQIYGFPHFNLPSDAVDKAEEATFLADILRTTQDYEYSDVESNQKTSADLSVKSLPPFQQLRVLHVDPLVLVVDDFFTADEADRYVAMSTNRSNKDILESSSPTVGKDAAARAQRTSTTWYHQFAAVPELMAKATRLLGIDGIERFEEPQTVRYRRNEKFTWHLDALGPDENQPKLGGQRLATLLVYLTDLTDDEGGATLFRDLNLRVQPRKGSALLFFPGAGGIPNAPFDIRTLHCGQAVSPQAQQDKWIAQLWLRALPYTPTAPPGNSHAAAIEAIQTYCVGKAS